MFNQPSDFGQQMYTIHFMQLSCKAILKVEFTMF